MKRFTENQKNKLRQVRHTRVRATVVGTAAMPRLSVFRGLKTLTLQLIDDASGKTLCFAKSSEVKSEAVEGKKAKVAAGFSTGKLLAEKAKAKGITKVVFDRGGYSYHG